jgi:hypothetical protein
LYIYFPWKHIYLNDDEANICLTIEKGNQTIICVNDFDKFIAKRKPIGIFFKRYEEYARQYIAVLVVYV